MSNEGNLPYLGVGAINKMGFIAEQLKAKGAYASTVLELKNV